MNINETKLEELKQKLYRLHFLLTEKQSEEIYKNGVAHFQECYKSASENLADFLKSEYGIKTKDYTDVINKSFEKNLFNETTLSELQGMTKAADTTVKEKDLSSFYNDIQEKYARLLQMIYDVLKRMGEEPPEDDND